MRSKYFRKTSHLQTPAPLVPFSRNPNFQKVEAYAQAKLPSKRTGRQDRRQFVETLAECCAKTRWQVHAYVLMPNHFHLVVETPQANLVAGMKWFLGTYTARFNRRHNLRSPPERALQVGGGGRFEASGHGYLKSACDSERAETDLTKAEGIIAAAQAA